MIESVILDWKRTLYDPDSENLIDGAKEVLDFLKDTSLSLYLVGKDLDGSMPEETIRLNVASYFSEIHLTTTNKTDDDIGRFIDQDIPESSLVVGDRVQSEIAVGNRLGAMTVWVAAGKFVHEVSEQPDQFPDFTIGNIRELIPLVEQLC